MTAVGEVAAAARGGDATVPARPAAGFAAALAQQAAAAHGNDPAGWRTVTLGEMLAAFGGAPATAAPGGPPGLAGTPAAALAGAPATGAAALAGAPGEVAVAAASGYLGVPYRWGGVDPATGLDCSGLVQRVFADLGVALPRVSADQARAGTPVASLADARPGDLVFWRGGGGRPNHIGIYAGGGQMVHAPRTGDVVRFGPVRSAPPDAIRRVL